MSQEGKKQKGLVDAFLAIRDRATMRRFLAEIFTPTEIRDVELRWALMRLLRDGRSQREVGRRLGVSLCKITRGARVLRQPRSVSAALLDQERRCDTLGGKGRSTRRET